MLDTSLPVLYARKYLLARLVLHVPNHIQQKESFMNSLIRILGRVLLASPFIRLGWDAAQTPGGRVDMAAAIGVPRPETAVRLNGAAMVSSGVLLALGIVPRWSALTLIGCLVPTTAAGHAFWKEEEQPKRTGQLIHFLKNVSMVGGLLVVVAEDE
jgi:putative oxidoreductase